MNNNYTEMMLNCIVQESKSFFLDEMAYTILKIKTTKYSTLYVNSAMVDLESDINFRVIISMDETLVSSLLAKHIQGDIDEYEEAELLLDMPREIVNTVVGLSIKLFKGLGDNITLSPPQNITKDKIEVMLENNDGQIAEIDTDSGRFICRVFHIA